MRKMFAMSTPQSTVAPEIRQSHSSTIQEFLHDSYEHTKKQIEHGVHFINNQVSFIKEELTTLYDRTGDIFQNMMSPVNNFLKDSSQMERDFLADAGEIIPFSSPSCSIIPIEIALLSPMEENY